MIAVAAIAPTIDEGAESAQAGDQQLRRVRNGEAAHSQDAEVILRSRMFPPLLTRKPWSPALHNAAAMAVPYSFSRSGNVGADNQLPCRCRQWQAQTTATVGVSSVPDPEAPDDLDHAAARPSARPGQARPGQARPGQAIICPFPLDRRRW